MTELYKQEKLAPCCEFILFPLRAEYRVGDSVGDRIFDGRQLGKEIGGIRNSIPDYAEWLIGDSGEIFAEKLPARRLEGFSRQRWVRSSGFFGLFQL